MKRYLQICLLVMASPSHLIANALIDAKGFGLKKRDYHSLGINSELAGLDSYQLYNPAVASVRDRSNPLSLNLALTNKSYGQDSQSFYEHSLHLAYAFRNPYGGDILIEMKNASHDRDYSSSTPANYSFKQSMNMTDVGFSFSRSLFERLMIGARARIHVNQLSFTMEGSPEPVKDNLLTATDNLAQESLAGTNFNITTRHAHFRTSLAYDLGFILDLPYGLRLAGEINQNKKISDFEGQSNLNDQSYSSSLKGLGELSTTSSSLAWVGEQLGLSLSYKRSELSEGKTPSLTLKDAEGQTLNFAIRSQDTRFSSVKLSLAKLNPLGSVASQLLGDNPSLAYTFYLEYPLDNRSYPGIRWLVEEQSQKLGAELSFKSSQAHLISFGVAHSIGDRIDLEPFNGSYNYNETTFLLSFVKH